MTKEESIRIARDAGAIPIHKRPKEFAIVSNENIERFFQAAYAAGAAAEREKVAAWMIQRSYATGHGDTTEDLLVELEWQVRESEREACAKVCDDKAMYCEEKAQEAIEAGEHDEVNAIRSTAWQISVCAAAIRARGGK